MRIRSRFARLLFSVLLPGMGARAEFIWVEGESPATKNVSVHGWYNSVKKEVLSGNEWLSHYGRAPGNASYRIEVEGAGRFTFWARANPVASKPQWRLDGGSWEPVPMGDKRGQQNIATDNKPDHRFIAWIRIGVIELAAGTHDIGFRWEGGAQNSGGLDCFVLTDERFVPQGKMKPTAGPGAVLQPGAPDEWFPLLPDEDTFSPESVIDMSRFVPAPAGKLGFLKAAGKKLKFEKSVAAVKLWGVGANVSPGKSSRAQLRQRAKYPRKFGVNVVRQHAIFDELNSDGKIDPAKLDEYDYWFAELKKNGIYSCWSVFYHFTIGASDGYPAELLAELDDARGGRKDTYGIITVSDKLWDIRNRVLVQFLQHKNPYTGLRYVDEPALAIVEMNNEDSVFFWNPLGWLAEGKKMPRHSRLLRQRWAAWVKAKYRTDTRLAGAWGELRQGDSVSADELRIMGPWELPGEGPRGIFSGMTRRAADYIQFLAEMQVENFARCEKAMRAAGFKGVSVTTGWQVGGAATEAANLWTDCAADMIDRHNYFGGGAGRHVITEGKVGNKSHLATPGGGIFSLGMKQVEDKPFSITEWTQMAPNQWKAECAPIMAFYGLGLQGWDASFHFIQKGTRLGDGWPRMSSYASDTPHYMGQFPALAFALYHNHIAESQPIAARRLTREQVFSGADALKQDFTKGGHDAKTIIDGGGTPAETFAAGRVTVAFDGGKSTAADLAKLWDKDAKVIRSVTGELVWDYGMEVITVRSARTQAVIGRVGGQVIRLPGVSIKCKTAFVSMIFTPLDNQPLTQSKRILITALARDKQAGARYNADGSMLQEVGTAPLMLEPVQATLKFIGQLPKRISVLDHHGMPTGRTVPVTSNGVIEIDGRYRTYYYEVRR